MNLRNFVRGFYNAFVLTEDCSINCSEEQLQLIQIWFNGSYSFVSLLTGIPLEPIVFVQPYENIANKRTVLHAFSVSYLAIRQIERTYPFNFVGNEMYANVINIV